MTSITLYSHQPQSHSFLCRLGGETAGQHHQHQSDPLHDIHDFSKYKNDIIIKPSNSPSGSCQAVGSCGSAAAGSHPWPDAEQPPAPAGWSAPRGRRCPFLHCHRPRRCCRPAMHIPRQAATQEARRYTSTRSPKTCWKQSIRVGGVEVRNVQCVFIIQQHAMCPCEEIKMKW